MLSVRFKDNYFYYQNVKPDASMTLVIDVRSLEFVSGIPKMDQVAWSAVPLFFNRYNNYYVRSGIFQIPLFRGPVDISHLQNMYNYDDPWQYISQKLNDRTIALWEATSAVIRVLDSQREVFYLTFILL